LYQVVGTKREVVGLLGLVALVALGLAVLMVVVPDRRAGERFLARWGIGRPTAEQIAVGTGYLRQRRLLYLICYLAGPVLAYAIAGLLRPAEGVERRQWWGLLASVLAALLLAELVAALRPARGTTRSAALSRRRWADLVPRWAVAVHLALVGLATAQAVAAIAAHGWSRAVVAAGGSGLDPAAARRLSDTAGSWLILVEAAFGLVGVYGVVVLAVRRRAEADPAVDSVLRTRSARVAVGVGIGLALGLINQTNSRVVDLRALALPDAGLQPAPGWLELAARLDGIGMILVLVLGLASWRIVAAPLGPSTPVAA
jgi:hypothetical protein